MFYIKSYMGTVLKLFDYFNPFRDKTMTVGLFIRKAVNLIKDRRPPRGLVEIFYKYNEVVLETSNICNVRCVWCWMYTSGRKDMGLMSLENFKKFIDLNCTYLKKRHIKVTPYHRGEPLLHPDFFDMLAYGKEKGVEFKEIHTNLSVPLDPQKLIDAPAAPKIFVNIGGIDKETHEKVMPGSDFMKVTGNLKNILEIKDASERIFLKMNVTKHNHKQIAELPDFFEGLGGIRQNVGVGQLSCCIPAEATCEERRQFIVNNVSEEIADYLKFTYDASWNIKSKEQKCPYMLPTVKFNGCVTICCRDQLSRLNLGNAFEVPLRKIMRSKKFKMTEALGEKKLLAFCKECN